MSTPREIRYANGKKSLDERIVGISTIHVERDSDEFIALGDCRNTLVYVVECQGHYKIGKTGVGALRRIEQLQTGNPYEIALVMAITTERASDLEISLHEHFQGNNKRGEWFTLNPDDLEELEVFALEYLHGKKVD